MLEKREGGGKIRRRHAKEGAEEPEEVCLEVPRTDFWVKG